jgi:hypothetical protein
MDENLTDRASILVCTVGGSHQPILTALMARRWDHVVFVCTREADSAAGSVAMIENSVNEGPPIPNAGRPRPESVGSRHHTGGRPGRRFCAIAG